MPPRDAKGEKEGRKRPSIAKICVVVKGEGRNDIKSLKVGQLECSSNGNTSVPFFYQSSAYTRHACFSTVDGQIGGCDTDKRRTSTVCGTVTVTKRSARSLAIFGGFGE